MNTAESDGDAFAHAMTTIASSVLQALVALFSLVMGLGWGGPTYIAALMQCGIGFVVIAMVARYRPHRQVWILLVPLISLALTFALVVSGDLLGHTGA